MSEDSLIFRAVRRLREMQRTDGTLLAQGEAKDWGDYRHRAGRLCGLQEAERELLELVDPNSRALINRDRTQP